MEVFKYKLEGVYSVQASTNDIVQAWNKFYVRNETPESYCDYQADEQGELSIYNYQSKEIAPLEPEHWNGAQPVFYETNNYNFTIFFESIKAGTKPHIIHPDSRVSEMFNCQEIDGKAFLNGSVNFLNEPGRFELKFSYILPDGQEKISEISFDVVSPKLDTKKDLKVIMEQLRAEYDDLIFRYLTLTSQQFAEGKEVNNDLIWLSIFKDIIDGYISAVRYITHRPHFRHHHKVEYLKAERIKKWNPQLTEKFMNDFYNDKEQSLKNLYHTERIETTEDTAENRFVKYTIERIADRLLYILRKIDAIGDGKVSPEEKKGLRVYSKELEKLKRAPLFKSIGRFDGFRQESIVMQQRTGYAKVYRYWFMLQNGLSIIDGKTSVGVLPVWQLYEVWCFLKMKRLVCTILGLDPHKSEDQQYIHEDRTKIFNPFSGSDLEDNVKYDNKENGDIIELGYQYTYSRAKHRDGMYSLTAEQRPDIVLNVIKKNSGITLTYLFDAKYRVKGDDEIQSIDDFDYPVEDTLNQMHRYRDAIYYKMRNEDNLSKEVIGAYILFPGRVHDENELQAKIDNGDFKDLPYFLKSIYEVNIGAYPLLPNDNSGILLRKQLEHIIKGQSIIEQIKDSVPQRGLSYSIAPEDNESLVLVGYYKNEETKKAILKNRLYYVRAGFRKGSLKIVPGFEHSKYLLLYKQDVKELYKLNDGGPAIISGQELRLKGFDSSGDYYLAFSIEDTTPIVEFIDEQGKILNLKPSPIPYDKEPKFMTIKELFE